MEKCYMKHEASLTLDPELMYNPAKAAQIIAYLALKTNERALNILKAIKMVYIADREMLKHHGIPMLEEPRVSMRHGPVNSRTYDNAKGEIECPEWSAILEDRANHLIGVRPGLVADDMDELSDAEVELLDAIWTKFSDNDQWALVDWTHNSENVPEWEDPGHSSSPIPLERVLRAVGIPDSAAHAEYLEDQANVRRILSHLQPA